MTLTEIISVIISGSALGWLAVPHCYGMCGPLHVSLCALNREKSLQAISIFNGGRVLGYTIAGALFGAFGAFINVGGKSCCSPGETGWRAIGLRYLFPAVMMLVIAIQGFRKKGLTSKSTNSIKRFFNPTGKLNLAIFGSATVLIPCGMLYVAFGGAIATAHIALGALFMFAFVVTQTFFMQLGVMLGRMVDQKWGKIFEKIFPWAALAIALVYAGLGIRKML
ncbi:MAG: hypothetical protein GF398_05905 [Chitinivibrionales bacterium]|nr:hypothetical protein [Chitinivibrionales bacterium]